MSRNCFAHGVLIVSEPYLKKYKLKTEKLYIHKGANSNPIEINIIETQFEMAALLYAYSKLVPLLKSIK